MLFLNREMEKSGQTFFALQYYGTGNNAFLIRIFSKYKHLKLFCFVSL